MYRPDNWKNPYRDPSYREKFEAGADAMLKALKKEGKHIVKGKVYCHPCYGCGNNEDCYAYDTGWLVFIPEEE